MRNIQPLIIPILGTATKIDVLVYGFSVDAINCMLRYKLMDEQNNVLIQDNYILTSEEYTNWGSDNDYLLNLLVNKLYLTLI